MDRGCGSYTNQVLALIGAKFATSRFANAPPVPNNGLIWVRLHQAGRGARLENRDDRVTVQNVLEGN